MILTAAWVLPVAGPPLRRGYVAIEGARVAEVGAADALPAARRAAAEDLGQTALTPGLVNPHTHLELTAYAGRIAPRPLWQWLGELVKLRGEPGRVERERRGVYEGAWQSLRAGVTCVGDISRENVAWSVLKPLPLRKVCFVELLTLADQPPRDPAELRAAVADVAEDDWLTVGVSPHAPYSVPAEQIRAAIALADELDRPWCTHWAETPEEIAFLAGDDGALPRLLRGLLRQCGVRSPRMTAGAYLEQCVAEGRPGALAHVNYVGAADVECIARGGHVVVYCPRAHRFFGHAPHPLRRLQAAGVPVAVGTDSRASNEGLSPLEELRFLRRHVADAPAADVLLRMVTLEAARALRLEERIGSLERGKQADLAAFPVAPGVDDPAAALVESCPAAAGVWVAGRRVV